MKKLVIVIGLIVSSSAFSTPSTSFWQDIQNKNIQQKVFDSDSIDQPLKQRTLSLNEQGLKALLTGENNRLALRPTKKSEIEIDLPLPDGGFVRVKAKDSPILSPELAQQYPDIKTWEVVGVDDPAITGRLDFTSKGFHGMLTMSDGDTVFIDPDKDDSSNVYHSLSKHENHYHFKTDFNCKVHTGGHPVSLARDPENFSPVKPAQIPAQNQITYRIAIAGTGEYTASQGGTAASAYASMITTINRVSQVYRSDLGINLQIVSDSSLAYTDAATDPYTNTDADLLVSQNIENLNDNNVLGVAAYDIGHVFAAANIGGLAYVGVACQNEYKAGGATGISNPQGEIFSIEYVAHEMGHQLGATHTFNSTQGGCGMNNRSQETAVEPGSGSTIMSYSGLCGSDDLQQHSDPYFHSASIDQIISYTRGASCGSRSAGDQKPTVNAGADIVIPINTPFLLDGTATGGSSYTWDQTDTGLVSAPGVDKSNNPIIRSLLSSSQDRYIPRLSDLFAGTSTKGEMLPQTVREMNFTYVVRNGSGGVGTDDKKVLARDTGATFAVLSQTTSQTIAQGSSIQVDWNVAGTNSAPINCSNVDIQLLRVNGVKNMLLANTPNDSSEQLTVPSNTPVMTNARIMVGCSDNSFFQISSGSIAVVEGTGDSIAPVITLTGSSSTTLDFGSNYVEQGATAVDNIDGTVTVSISGSVNTQVAGTYTITYTATDSSGNTSTKTRIVTVNAAVGTDTSAPMITLVGGDTLITLEIGQNFVDPGFSAFDDRDGTVKVVVSGSVNIHKAGTYILTYTATDSKGNKTVVTRKVLVTASVDTTAPVITLTGDKVIEVVVGEDYSDPGYAAFDDRDGIVNIVVKGKVDTTKTGTYVITYIATDAAGNTFKEERTINVIAEKANDTENGEHTDTPATSSGGGSIGYLLLPLGLLTMRRKLLKRKSKG